jgi:hypothetical protein
MSLTRQALAWLRPRAARLRALAIDPRARSEVLTRLRYGARVHQDTSVSFPDRYPRLFAAAAALLADRPACRILSYGCAAGEEVLSLRGYFPQAALVGAEINQVLLARCRRLPPDPRRTFIASTPDTIAAHGPYDAVFAMAVFTRRPHTVEARGMRDIARHYPFALFARDLRFLAAQVAPGGLLIVEHALYLAEDALAGTPLAAAFRPVEGVGDWLAKGPRFAPHGRIIEPQPRIARVFRRERA